jgi:hypothetical protein
MSFEYIKEHYGVPADIGRRVIMDGRSGTIVEDRGKHLGVVFDDTLGVVCNVHPTWKMGYGKMWEESA